MGKGEWREASGLADFYGRDCLTGWYAVSNLMQTLSGNGAQEFVDYADRTKFLIGNWCE